VDEMVKPEEKAREVIDQLLTDAGWKVESIKLTEYVTFFKNPRNFGTDVIDGKTKTLVCGTCHPDKNDSVWSIKPS